jgi:hypothetical protein
MTKKAVIGILSGALFAGLGLQVLFFADNQTRDHFSNALIIVMIIIPFFNILGIVFSEKVIFRVRRIKIVSISLGYLFHILAIALYVVIIDSINGISRYVYGSELAASFTLIILSSFIYGGYYLGSYDNERGK